MLLGELQSVKWYWNVYNLKNVCFNGKTRSLEELVRCSSCLQVFTQFPAIKDAISLHLVEISPKLGEIQCQLLTGCTNVAGHSDEMSHGKQSPAVQQNADVATDHSRPCYRSAVSRHNFPINWYRSLKDVPRERSFFVAHEFLDALPIYKFQVVVIVLWWFACFSTQKVISIKCSVML